MKISRNWLNKYIKSEKSDNELVDAFTQLGLECTSTKLNSIDPNIVIGQVLNCYKHPDADRLKVCEVDISNGELLTIVCGAPNVTKNILVPVAKIGSKIGEFKIKKSKIRGVLSNGMICSEKELGLSDNHNGIMILDSTFNKGDQLKEALSVEEDTVFDFDITPNRGDCLSHIGIARELSIIEKNNTKINLYDKKNTKLKEKNETLTITIDNDKCKRYVACIIRNITVNDSPDWLKRSIESIGQKSINNVVDAANYILMDLGHPMHTFDLDKIKSKNINVRLAKSSETILTLEDSNEKLNSNNLLICDGNIPIAIAGIIGGNNSGVDKKTKNILIESAYFDPLNIRKSSKTLGISTEASRRFERDTDINMLIPALNKLALLIQNVAGGEISSKIFDIYDNDFDGFDSNGFLLRSVLRKISFDINECNDFLGTNLSLNEIKNIFSSLFIEFKEQAGKLICEVPSFRNDISRQVDLFEEVARVVGYNKIPSSNKFSAQYKSLINDKYISDMIIREHLCSNGFHEHYSNSLVHYKFTKHFSNLEPIEVNNPLSKEMQYLRNSIIPGLLLGASYNEKRQEKVFNIFEIGAVHTNPNNKKQGSIETFELGILWYGEISQMHWRKFEDRDIFKFKGDIVNILNRIGIKTISFEMQEKVGFSKALSIYINKRDVGVLGVPNKKIVQDFKLNSSPCVCYISLNKIREMYGSIKNLYKQPTIYPSISRDIAIQVANDIQAEDLLSTIRNNGGQNLIDVLLFDVYYSKNVGENYKSLAFSIKFQSDSITLTDIEVDNHMSKILDSLKSKYNAKQR